MTSEEPWDHGKQTKLLVWMCLCVYIWVGGVCEHETSMKKVRDLEFIRMTCNIIELREKTGQKHNYLDEIHFKA